MFELIQFIVRRRFGGTCLFFLLALLPAQHTLLADLVLRESFDIPVGTLDNQAGATSFGFDPDYGTVWDSGIYSAPDVGAGSIIPPDSTAAFYDVSPVGNRYSTNNGTDIGRTYDLNLNGPHFFGSFLTTTSLHPSGAEVFFNFQNFAFRAVNAGNGSFWRMQDSFGQDTNVSADGTTLVLWELEFNQQAGAADTFRAWFNTNPLTDVPDFESSAFDLGYNNLGGGAALSFHSYLYLGLSSLEIDEIRIGTDWSGVGVSSVPEPSGIGMFIFGCFICIARRRRLIIN